MAQIASVLAVATVFISLWTRISRQRRGLYARQKYLCRNLSQKCRRWLIREGGGRNGTLPWQNLYIVQAGVHVHVCSSCHL